LGRPSETASTEQIVKVLDENELMPFLRSTPGLSATTFELTRSAHEFHAALVKTAPRKRGRGSA